MAGKPAFFMHPNLFDSIQRTSFNTTLTVFGYDAEWQPASGEEFKCGRVHYKEPTQEWEFEYIGFEPNQYIMEYQFGVFPGLHESVNSNGLEHVWITLTNEEIGCVEPMKFFCHASRKKYDGKTIQVHLQKVAE